MKKLGLLAVLSAAMLSITMFPATALEDNENGVVNKTGMTIEEFYISPSNQESWGPDILKSGVLEDGQHGIIKFSPNDDNCVFDVKIVDENDKAWIVEEVDLCKNDTLVFAKQGGKVVYMTANE
jgi:hypothetical protein